MITLAEKGSLERSLMIGDLDVVQICEFLSMGIRGFLSGRTADAKLHAAIVSVCSGRLVVSRAALEHYVAYSQSRLCSRTNERRSLTPRQHQLVQLLGQGNTNKEISSALNISENTVKFHMAKLFFKLGIHNRRAIRSVIDPCHVGTNCDAATAASAISELPNYSKSQGQ